MSERNSGARARRTHGFGMLGAVAIALVSSCNAAFDPGQEGTQQTTRALTVNAACLAGADAVPDDAWVCPAELVVECQDRTVPDAVETIYVDPGSGTCANVSLQVSPGPYGPGTHRIAVTAAAPTAGPTPCVAMLRVVDTRPPVTRPHDLELWPPNHKMHTVSIDDCVTAADVCDASVEVHFLSAASDEPADSTGDGATVGDIEFVDCSTVKLRAERQGGGDGRVYTLAWQAQDDAGHVVDGTCRVSVPHDQGKAPDVTGNPASYQVTAPSCSTSPAP